jgi:trans-aconitate methyltransferase
VDKQLTEFDIWNTVNPKTFLDNDRANPARGHAAKIIERAAKAAKRRVKYTVLEVGPGNGIDYHDHFSRLEKLGIIAYSAIEPSQALLKEFKSRSPNVPIQQGTFSDLRKKQTDCLYTKAVFEHQPDILFPLSSVLAAARLLIVVNWYIPPDDAKAAIRYDETEKVFYNCYSETTVKEIIESAGWAREVLWTPGSTNALYVLTKHK